MQDIIFQRICMLLHMNVYKNCDVNNNFYIQTCTKEPSALQSVGWVWFVCFAYGMSMAQKEMILSSQFSLKYKRLVKTDPHTVTVWLSLHLMWCLCELPYHSVQPTPVSLCAAILLSCWLHWFKMPKQIKLYIWFCFFTLLYKLDLKLFSGLLVHHCLQPISQQLSDLCRHFIVGEMEKFAIWGTRERHTALKMQ